MQDFCDNEKKTIKNDRQLATLYFVSAKFAMGYPCASPHILLYMHGPAFFLCLWVILRKYHIISQIQNGR